MNRFRRRFLHVSMAASLLLFTASSSLWVWSYFGRSTSIGFSGTSSPQYQVSLSPGWFTIVWLTGQPLGSDEALGFHIRPTWDIAAFHYHSQTISGWTFYTPYSTSNTSTGSPTTITMLSVHCYLPFLLTAAFSAICIWREIKLRKQLCGQAGHCSHCGYDLRATPDRCPECGTPAVAKVE